MKKAKLFAASLAAMVLVGCTDEEYVGAVDNPTGDGIGFGSGVTATTRGTTTGLQAAEKLNNNFIVYGFKTSDDTEANPSTDQMVFDHYNVNYMAGTANTTESNTADWEYVGYANHSGSVPSQTIKYWDFSAKSYVFSAVSGTGITAEKITTGSMYEKGWTVKIPAGGDISTLYASDRKPVAPSDYKKQVDLTFRSLITKIRFAMYEVIPGYEVHIDKFYYGSTGSWNNTETNFAINGTFKTVSTTSPTNLNVTYYDNGSGIENRPKVSYSESGTGAAVSATNKTFGANIQATPAIGTTSAEATYDQSDKSYTLILPYESSALSTPAENNLELYVDYTLTSTDGSGETIKVWHASAKVPSNFAQWKPNFAYTYIFKISDNSNGTTVTPGTDPTDPFTENDPTTQPDPEKIGLFPITFDAVVVTDETDVQETITSVSNPSITTYQEGKIVTENDEYVAGTIFFEDGALNVTNYHVYEVKNFGSEATTEKVIANWKNNFCVLTEVTTYDASTLTPAGIPLSNGTYISKTAGQAKAFAAEAGKTYVIANNDAASATQYKVVKVVGSPAAVTYTVGSNATITAVDGTATINVNQGSSPVLGVTPNFTVVGTVNNNKGLKIAESGNGNYTVSVDAAAIAAGKANDTYKVSFDGNDVTITVNISTALATSSINVVAGNTIGATATLNIGGAAADGDVTEVPAGITIEKTATGTYKVTAASNVAAGTYTAKIGGQTLSIIVDSYAFLSDLVIDMPYNGTTKTGTLTLQKNGDVATGITTLTGSDDNVATYSAADGVYTYTAKAGGSFDVTYENAKATVTVNKYSLVSTSDAIAASTGSATLSLMLKNSSADAHVINAVAAKVAVAAYDFESNAIAAPNYTLTTDGQKLTFRAVTKGNYSFTYIENEEYVAQIIIRVE